MTDLEEIKKILREGVQDCENCGHTLMDYPFDLDALARQIRDKLQGDRPELASISSPEAKPNMPDREKIAQHFFYRKYPPSNDALAYNLRWTDIPFDGCESSKPFYDEADYFLALIPIPQGGRPDREKIIDWLVIRRRAFQTKKDKHTLLKPKDKQGAMLYGIKARALQEVINYLKSSEDKDG